MHTLQGCVHLRYKLTTTGNLFQMITPLSHNLLLGQVL